MQPLLVIGVVISFCILSMAGIYMFSIWDFSDEYRRGNIITYIDKVQPSDFNVQGLHIKPPEDVHAILNHPDHHPLLKMILFASHAPGYFLKMAGLKVWYLFSFNRPYYSTLHNLYALLWAFAAYALSCLGWIKLENSPIKYHILCVIILNAMLIAVATVDWDNRFFIPMEPAIVCLVGGGCMTLIKRSKTT